MLFSVYAVCRIQAFFLSIHDAYVWSKEEGLCPVVVVVVYVVVVIIHEYVFLRQRCFVVLLVPSSLDPPLFRNVTATSLTIYWDPPEPPNGVLLHYIIYQNNTEIQRVMGNITSFTVTGLQPFTVYVFRLSVCTAVGCSNSSDSVPQRTAESGKDL